VLRQDEEPIVNDPPAVLLSGHVIPPLPFPCGWRKASPRTRRPSAPTTRPRQTKRASRRPPPPQNGSDRPGRPPASPPAPPSRAAPPDRPPSPPRAAGRRPPPPVPAVAPVCSQPRGFASRSFLLLFRRQPDKVQPLPPGTLPGFGLLLGLETPFDSETPL